MDDAERDWHAAQPADPKPMIVHHEIDDQLQTGESRLLGGAMTTRSPWSNDEQQDPP